MSNYMQNNLTGDLAPVNVETQKIEQAVDSQLDRNPAEGQDNAMQTELDMNSYRIINIAQPINGNDAARLKDVQKATTTGLPDQTGNAGKFLKTDGGVVSWGFPNKSRTLTEAKTTDFDIGDLVETSGYNSEGDGGGNAYVVVAAGTGTEDDVKYINMDNGNQLFSLSLPENKTFSIPTHFSDLQTALNALGRVGEKALGNITLNIETGETLSSGFRVQDGDWSWITVTSSDAVVSCASPFTFVSNTDLESDVPRSASICFLAVSAKMPNWDVLVDISGIGAVTGYELDYGSFGVVRNGKGVTGNDSGTNCRVTSNSELQAAQSDFSTASAGCVAVTLSSVANLQSAVLSGAGASACLDVSRGSYVHCKDADLSGGASEGLYVRRSIASAQGINLTNCATGVFCAQGSRVGAHDAIFDGCTSNGQYNQGSYLDVSGSTKSGAPLSPSDFVTANYKGVGGTQSADKFNKVSGGGVITNKDFPLAHSEYLTSGDSLSVTSGDLVSVAATTYETILNVASGGATVIGGSIYGRDLGLRITVDGNVVLNDGTRARGEDGAGDRLCSVNIPPCAAKDTLLIEAYNRSSLSNNIGYKIYSK